ncbi:MAG: prolipoprotein diacylglyceryl transferase [Spirochaetales bacterium]|nr:prolipoprotein diacylglyceryl transferase [Spirochaetales bacterium]
MTAFIQYPAWIRPEIIPGLPVRWYGLMYIFAFATAYFLTRYQVKERKLDMTSDDLSNLIFYTILGLLLGARIFSALVYDATGLYFRKPWLIFWPFDANMRLVGLQGMSYHGGVIGATIAIIIYCRVNKLSIREYGDIIVTAVPLGYTFGRLGNFFNAELYGRVTESPLGMVFPTAPRFPLSLDWVQRLAGRLGIEGMNGMVNLPRHPSQLYEAFFEGIVLWLLMWFIFRKKDLVKGTMIGIYMIGYGLARFFIEYFREPDAELGFVLPLGGGGETYRFDSLLNLTTGQILCLIMIAGGTATIVGVRWYEKNRGEPKHDQSVRERHKGRKLRKIIQRKK